MDLSQKEQVLELLRDVVKKVNEVLLRHPTDHTKFRVLSREDIWRAESLLVEIMAEGKVVYDLPPLEAIREQRRTDLEHLDPGIRRLVNPHIYHVSLTQEL
jgi:nicotinate phosphoribosyltransferase